MSKIGSSYSAWANVTRSIHQRYFLGPLLFNIFVNDILKNTYLLKNDICNFAGDNAYVSLGDNLSVILKSLEHEMKIFPRWFSLNSLKTNPQKFQFMLLGKSI